MPAHANISDDRRLRSSGMKSSLFCISSKKCCSPHQMGDVQTIPSWARLFDRLHCPLAPQLPAFAPDFHGQVMTNQNPTRPRYRCGLLHPFIHKSPHLHEISCITDAQHKNREISHAQSAYFATGTLSPFLPNKSQRQTTNRMTALADGDSFGLILKSAI